MSILLTPTPEIDEYGMAEYEHWDGVEDKLVIETVQDVEPILEENLERFNSTEKRHPDFRHTATIPNILVHKWMLEGINIWTREGWERAKKLLNDPDYRKLRTAPGRI